MSWAPDSYLATALFGAAALAAVALVHADPWAAEDDVVPLMSTRSMARRVFPALGDREVARATIEFEAADGALVRIVPAPDGGHHVMQGDELLGPADPEAVEGIWASLRMATTLRAVQAGSDVGAGQGGRIRVSFADESATLTLGRETPEGSGVYGRSSSEGDELWVVEMEMRWLVDQPPRSWLAQRVSPLEPQDLVALAWGDDLALGRGEDGIWRVQVGPERMILSNDAVDQRLEQLLGARMDPILERQGIAPESLRPWLSLTTPEGHTSTLVLGGDCPGHSDRLVIDRGPGLLGCIPKQLSERWPLLDADAGMLEARLVPHAYGRVLVIDQREPSVRRLRRRTGGWLLEDAQGRRPVDEAEVFRWFDALARLEVERFEGGPAAGDIVSSAPAFDPEIELLFEMDSTQVLTLRCQQTAAQVSCARDEGPPLRIVGEVRAPIAFAGDTFVDRRLTKLASEDVRGVEILPGAAAAGRPATTRQSAHRDLGVWRLDAPQHPDGDAAIDEVRLEALLAAASSIRAEAWHEAPLGPPQRHIILDVAAAGAGPTRVEIALHLLDDGDACAATVDAGRAARLAEASCAALADDLLFDDPLRHFIAGARSLELGEGDASTLIRRDGERWVDAAGIAIDATLADRIAAWEALRGRALVDGRPPAGPAQRLVLRRDEGATVRVDVGAGWIALADAAWYYAVETVRER